MIRLDIYIDIEVPAYADEVEAKRCLEVFLEQLRERAIKVTSARCSSRHTLVERSRERKHAVEDDGDDESDG